MDDLEYKVGDVVKCIENTKVSKLLTKGGLYVVEKIGTTYTSVINDSGKIEEFFHSRFEKVDTGLTRTQELIKKVCEEIENELINKNRKYGDSALNPKRVFSKCDNIEQINVRIDDKISRIMSSQDDDTEDAEFDLLGYLVLKRVAKRYNEK